MVGSDKVQYPPIQQLHQVEPLSAALARDKAAEDCLPCRVMGASAFMGLGAYTYFSGQSQLRQQQAKILKSGSMFGMKSRQAGITGLASTLFVVGLYRLVN